jgi:hypothetical protein
MPIQTVKCRNLPPCHAGLLGIHPNLTLDRIRPNPESPTQAGLVTTRSGLPHLGNHTRIVTLCEQSDQSQHRHSEVICPFDDRLNDAVCSLCWASSDGEACGRGAAAAAALRPWVRRRRRCRPRRRRRPCRRPRRRRSHGRAVQVEPMKLVLKAPGSFF